MEVSPQSPPKLSSYLAHLPALFEQEEADKDRSPDKAFVSRFLLGFERLLSGLQSAAPKDVEPTHAGVEAQLDQLYTTFVPLGPDEKEPAKNAAPDGFLPWLAGWVALSLREDLQLAEKRRLISGIVSLYRHRGTKRGLVNMLKTLLPSGRQIEIQVEEFSEPAHYFQVRIKNVDENDGRVQRIAAAIIDQEKPAHTVYALYLVPKI